MSDKKKPLRLLLIWQPMFYLETWLWKIQTLYIEWNSTDLYSVERYAIAVDDEPSNTMTDNVSDKKGDNKDGSDKQQ